MTPLEVHDVTDAAALAALEPAWWELWRRAPAATPFQAPAWLAPWWRAFAPGALATVAVHHGGRLVGLAPMYREHGPLGRRLLPVGLGTTDHLDVLLDRDFAAPAAQAIAARLAARDDWDVCRFEELAPGAAALDLPCPPGLDDASAPQSPCPVLSPCVVPAGKARKLRMSRHRAARRGAVEIAATRDTDAFLAALVRLHALRWRARGEDGLLGDPRFVAFLRAAFAALARAGLLRAYLLRIDGAVVGAHAGLHHRDRAYAYLGGFDPAYAHESPGTILMGHAIAAAALEKASALDLLRGAERYKYDWGAVDRWNVVRTWSRR